MVLEHLCTQVAPPTTKAAPSDAQGSSGTPESAPGTDGDSPGGGFASVSLLPDASRLLCTSTDCRLLVYRGRGSATPSPEHASGAREGVEASPESGSSSGKKKKKKRKKQGEVEEAEGGREGEDGAEGGEAGSVGVGLVLASQLVGRNEEIVDLRFVGGAAEHPEKALAVATNSEQIRVYSVPAFSCQLSLLGHTDIVLCLDSWRSPTGHPFLVSSAKDHSVRVWDAASGRCLAVGQGHTAAVPAVAFSSRPIFGPMPSSLPSPGTGEAGAGKSAKAKAKGVHTCPFLVSASSDRTLKLWMLPQDLFESSQGRSSQAGGGGPGVLPPAKLRSKATVVAHDKDINSVSVAPNDSLVCTGSQDRTAKVWRIPELRQVLVLRGHKRGVWCTSFSPVDRCVLTASGDATVRVWSLQDGSCLKTLQGHSASVLKASFVSRGMQVVSAGADGLLKLWNARTAECINTFGEHEDKVWALAVAGAGETLATGGSDSLAVVWKDSTAEEAGAAAQLAAEELEKETLMGLSVARQDFKGAMDVAFALKRPHKMMTLLQSLLQRPDAASQILDLVGSLRGSPDRLQLLLQVRGPRPTIAKEVASLVSAHS